MKKSAVYPTMNELAEEACIKHKDIDKATAYIKRRFARDPALKAHLLALMVKQAIESAVYQERHAIKRGVKRKAARCKRSPTSLGAIVNVCREYILDTWLLDGTGTKLRDATPLELIPLERTRRAHGLGNLAVADFYASIIKAVPLKTKIGKKLTNEMTEKMWVKARSNNALQPEPEMAKSQK